MQVIFKAIFIDSQESLQTENNTISYIIDNIRIIYFHGNSQANHLSSVELMEMVTLFHIPPELKIEIMLNLTPKDLQSLCRTSRAHAAVCATDYFWQRRFQLDYPTIQIPPEDIYKKNMRGNYKQLWITVYKTEKSPGAFPGLSPP